MKWTKTVIVTKSMSLNRFDIRQPRWRDRVVLLAKYKVGQHNAIIFEEVKSLPGEFYLSGEIIKDCPLESNGTIACYAVPLDKMERLETSADINKTIDKLGW